MEVIIIFVMVAVFLIFGYAACLLCINRSLTTSTVWAGTTSYIPSATFNMTIPWGILELNSTNSIVACANQNGPLLQDPISNDAGMRYWERGEYLVCKRFFGKCTTGHFYLAKTNINEYRIVQCTYAMNTYANSKFNIPNVTLVAEVVAIYNEEINKVNYKIGTNTKIIPEIDWEI